MPSAPSEREEHAVPAVPAAAVPTEGGERAGYTVSVAATPRKRREHAVRAVNVAAAPPEFSPSPLSRLKRNAVTPVVMRPMTVTDNQLGRGTGEEGDKDKG